MSLSKNQKSPLSKLYKKFSGKKSESSGKKLEEDEARSSSSSSSSLNVDELRSVFDYIDLNSDGKISGPELQSFVGLLGGALEAEEILKITDIDGDGFMDFEEFLKLMEGEGEDDDGEERRKEELKEAFRLYVTEEEKEFITAASLRRTLSRLGESCTVDACKAMIRGFDQNGDGVLSFDEFLLMMR